MKELEDFQIEKTEVKSIYGGYVAEPTYTISRDGNGNEVGYSDSQD
ncbi:hypothetical protein ABXT06_05095 [Flavobacterium sp. UW10123]